MRRGEKASFTLQVRLNSTIPFALLTVAAPAQATPFVSPCSSEVHSAHAHGRGSQLLPLSVPPLPRLLALFKAFNDIGA
jgi:hypothetical protein